MRVGGSPLEEGMAIHSSILAWRIPWTQESGGGGGWGCYSPWSHKESDATEVTEHAYTCGRASKDQMHRFEIDQTLSNKETIWPKGFLGSLSNWDMKWR